MYMETRESGRIKVSTFFVRNREPGPIISVYKRGKNIVLHPDGILAKSSINAGEPSNLLVLAALHKNWMIEI